MRLSLSRKLAVATIVTGLVVVTTAQAQNFNGVTWVALTRGGVFVSDAVGPGAADHTDVVGAAVEADAAVFVASDATDLFFRIRVNDKPTDASNAFKAAVWGCAIDTNGTGTNYEYLATFLGTANLVHWRYNMTTVTANSASEPAEVSVSTHAGATFARAIASATSISSTVDWFVDFAVPWTTIRAGGNGAPAIVAGAPMRFACGTGPDGAFHIGTDPASATAAPTLDQVWSDPFVCTDTGCLVDNDFDGVSNVDEVAFNTNVDDKDTDGDGIPDNIELSSGAGPYGPYTNPDTDGDGVKDVKDVDSDNDCKLDFTEGAAGFRNAAVPDANPSANCSGTKPVCLRTGTKGTCIACDGDFSGATPAKCPFSTSPLCHTTGALTGACTACDVGKTALCTTAAAPACKLDTGACGACDGNFGGAQNAVCPVATLPACQLAGTLVGQCKECSAAVLTQCTGVKSTCNVATGACTACNGDCGGGATQACPSTTAPRCALTGGTMGTCSKCTSNADCGAGHTGPTCDVPSGACIDIDTDGDGLNDSVEKLLGTDPAKKDTDGDGIDDLIEVTPPGGGQTTKVDTDGDGTIDALDTDSDNDGVLDKDEGVTDVDGDSLGNWRDADDDGDTIPTITEIADTAAAQVDEDVDKDGKKNWYDNDADGDGKTDGMEGRTDTDGDTIPDYLDNFAGKQIDAGPPVVTEPMPEAGPPPPPGPDTAVLEGTGLFCGSSRLPAKHTSWMAIASLLAMVVAAARRRNRSSAP